MRRVAGTCIGLTLAGIVLLPQGANALAERTERCAFGPERDVVLSLLNLDGEQAGLLIDQLDPSTALIPSPDFYRALTDWYEAYQSGESRDKATAINAMRDAVGELEQRYQRNNSPRMTLATGLAAGHTARVLFDNEQLIAGSRLGVRARERFTAWLEDATAATPGYPDARFLQGLFEVHTAALARRGDWLPKSLRFAGNRELGIRLIEATIGSDAVFAAEAGRALLAEVNWRTPAFCRYVNMIDRLGAQLPNNSDVATLRQGLMLKCGLVERARNVNDRYRAAAGDKPVRDTLVLARMRILASSGAVEQIRLLKEETDRPHLADLALANALDVDGQREQALAVYTTLEQDKTVADAIRKVARVRIRFPFVPRPTVHVPQFFPLLQNRC